MSKQAANVSYYAKGYEDPVKFLRINKVHNFIFKYLPDFKNKNILDIGCYGSHLLHELHDSGYKNLYGIDIVPQKNQYKFRYNFTMSDIEQKTKFKDNTFDVVVMSHVLEHLYNVPAALEEIQRILKKNGYFVLCLPLDLNFFARLRYFLNAPIHDPFSTGTHIKFYKYKRTIAEMKKRGFIPQQIEFSFINYGKYDGKFPFFKTLAKQYPDMFSSEIVVLFKNKKK